ncbi:General amino acid permease [Mycena indigotica]|uniref:General amino acid permease n=1 Tax=Mycena indigotica TaxID=2126181 RepID=A0A8H6S9R0_9AGAR|nr:General amino acid permease [Mycena indigotica]KAF7294780.1 General amino acid permease [Mycena indigotica]
MDNEKGARDKPFPDVDVVSHVSDTSGPRDQTHRSLKSRHIQLIGIGGTIGTALFVQIGSSLTRGGPGSLFLAFTIWSTFILAVNNCLSEMVTWIPIASPFVRFADRFVDPALGFCAGVNFFIFEAALVPFEVVAFNLVLQFWTDKIPISAVIAFVLLCYAFLNLFAVGWYGETEFYLSIGKVILAVGLMLFTFFTMVGGNPLHDTYGFRNWNPSKVPGAPFAEHIKTGDLGRFLGFLSCLIQASFTIAGPDYVSMTAGEAEFPRRTLPRAFKAVFVRLTAFFVLGSLCVGIVVPYNDENLLKALSDARPGAGSSPYVIAMERMKIPILPHIVNALIMTSIFSAGNSYVYCASRTLFGLALQGKMPRFLAICTKRGVPIYSVLVTLVIALLSFLQVSNNASVVLQWFVNLVTASQLLNYAIISFSYLKFYYAMKAQGIPRDYLPHKSFWQPFCGQILCFCWNLRDGICWGLDSLPARELGCANLPILLRVTWCSTSAFHQLESHPSLVLKRMVFQWQRSEDVTFFHKEREEIDFYEESSKEPEKSSGWIGTTRDFLFG